MKDWTRKHSYINYFTVTFMFSPRTFCSDSSTLSWPFWTDRVIVINRRNPTLMLCFFPTMIISVLFSEDERSPRSSYELLIFHKISVPIGQEFLWVTPFRGHISPCWIIYFSCLMLCIGVSFKGDAAHICTWAV